MVHLKLYASITKVKHFEHNKFKLLLLETSSDKYTEWVDRTCKLKPGTTYI